MGTSFYAVFTFLMVTILNYLMVTLNKNCIQSRVIFKITEKICNLLDYSFYIRLFIELNLDLIINCYIQFMVIKSARTFCDYLSVSLAAISGLISVLAPFASSFIIHKLKN